MDLQRGQRFKLSEGGTTGKLELTCEIAGIPASDLRVLMLVLDANEKLVEGQLLDASGGSRRCDGVSSAGRAPGAFELELERIPARVARLVLVLTVTESARAKGVHADAIRSGVAALASKGSRIAAYSFKSTDFGRETALCLVEIYRKDGWRMMASGVGFLGGLPSLISRYGARIDEIEGGQLLRPPAPPLPSPPSGGSAPPAGKGQEIVRVPGFFAGRREPSVPTDLTPAMGLVLVERSDGAATGTGFMIGPGGWFVTCAHVVRDAQSISFVAEGTQELRPAVVDRVDPDGDLALLHTIDRRGATDWLVLSNASTAPKLGDTLGLLGYPLGGQLGINLTYSQGVINSLRKAENIPILQVDTGAAPGSSGGPVFRRSDGFVVGVLTSGLTLQTGGMLVNFAVGAQRLWQLGWLAD